MPFSWHIPSTLGRRGAVCQRARTGALLEGAAAPASASGAAGDACLSVSWAGAGRTGGRGAMCTPAQGGLACGSACSATCGRATFDVPAAASASTAVGKSMRAVWPIRPTPPRHRLKDLIKAPRLVVQVLLWVRAAASLSPIGFKIVLKLPWLVALVLLQEQAAGAPKPGPVPWIIGRRSRANASTPNLTGASRSHKVQRNVRFTEGLAP